MGPLDVGVVWNWGELGIIPTNPEKASCIISEANRARDWSSVLFQTHVRKRCEEECHLLIHFGKWGDETCVINGHDDGGSSGYRR